MVKHWDGVGRFHWLGDDWPEPTEEPFVIESMTCTGIPDFENWIEEAQDYDVMPVAQARVLYQSGAIEDFRRADNEDAWQFASAYPAKEGDLGIDFFDGNAPAHWLDPDDPVAKSLDARRGISALTLLPRD